MNVNINDALSTKEIIKEDFFKVGDLVEVTYEKKEIVEEPIKEDNTTTENEENSEKTEIVETEIVEVISEVEEYFIIVGVSEDSLITWVVNPEVPEGMTQTSISKQALKQFKTITILNR